MAGAQLLTRQLNSPWRCNFIANPLYSKCTKVALPRCFIRALREPGLGISPRTIPGQRFRGEITEQRPIGSANRKAAATSWRSPAAC